VKPERNSWIWNKLSVYLLLRHRWGRGYEVCDQRLRVCLLKYVCVCLSARISQKTNLYITSRNFCTCHLWPWLSPPLTTVHSVM